METTGCNLCGNKSPKPLYQLTDLLLERPEVHAQLVRCPECGLIYQNPRPTLAGMGAHYPDDYESYDAPPDEQQMSLLMRLAYRRGVAKRVGAITRYKAAGRLLDVGCSTGTFLLAMRKIPGWEVCGVEISEHAARIAREKHHLDVFVGTLEAAHFPDESFDAVTLWDVLEHLHDPAASLREIHRILKPGGLLTIRVPNVDSWDAKMFGAAWAGYDAPRHLYVFGPQTLKKILQKNSFRILRMRCDIGSYPTFVLSVRFWLLEKGIGKAARKHIARILYHPIARLLSAPFFYLSSKGLRGPLLIVTVAKEV